MALFSGLPGVGPGFIHSSNNRFRRFLLLLRTLCLSTHLATVLRGGSEQNVRYEYIRYRTVRINTCSLENNQSFGESSYARST